MSKMSFNDVKMRFNVKTRFNLVKMSINDVKVRIF
jgi:hypothetical protein